MRFGRLTVIEEDLDRKINDLKRKENKEIKRVDKYWKCKCDCGNIVSVFVSSLKKGSILSCGCYNSEIHQKSNIVEFEGDIARLYDSKGDSTIIDREDYYKINKWCWYKGAKDYWVAKSKKVNGYDRNVIRLHQEIIKIKMGIEYYDTHKYVPDHLNRNKSDNRKINLELKTFKENSRNISLAKNNTSGKTGVYYEKRTGKYFSQITVNGKQLSLGTFSNKEDAINARIQAEIKYGFTCDNIYPTTSNI